MEQAQERLLGKPMQRHRVDRPADRTERWGVGPDEEERRAIRHIRKAFDYLLGMAAT